jgi:hypothetical protein
MRTNAIPSRVLYLGDGTLAGAARYLAGILRGSGRRFDHAPSTRRLEAAALEPEYGLYILSDFPASRMTRVQMRAMARRIFEGASLLMVGGWASFGGPDGRYAGTPIGQILPVRCATRDDRRQGAQAYRIVRASGSPGFGRFDFAHAPGICGYNQVKLAPGGREYLSVETLAFDRTAVQVVRRDPLLALGEYGAGEVGALATDLAPHWVGGLVDWGTRRVTLEAAPGITAEVGTTYVRFVREILRILTPPRPLTARPRSG